MSEEMKKMFEQSQKFTSPSEAHKKLADYVGKWDCTFSMGMGPGGMSVVGKSKSEISWLMKDRFIREESSGSLMGMPYQGFFVTGYDNFKQAYVSAMADSLNTYLLTSQGKLAQDGKTLISYGTLDEYLTGENDKPVKYVRRWKDADHFTVEVHDLAIGEENTKVVEIAYARAK